MELKCVNSVAKPIEKSATTGGKSKNYPKTCVCVFLFLLFPQIPFGGLIGRLGQPTFWEALCSSRPPRWNIYWRSPAPKFLEECVNLFQDQCS